VHALAKVNLLLEVLNKRADGFHDLRTIFQTISLADTIDLEWRVGGKPGIELDSAVEIPNNLVLRAAEKIICETNSRGRLQLRLRKVIPMGGGLGGGSTDAAAVLIALPVLTGRAVAPERLHAIAAELGSDVPFFLTGGTALGIGRGTEVYPLADAPRASGLLVAPDVHVSTAEAYTALGRGLTVTAASHKINSSQLLASRFGAELSAEEWSGLCSNDFEPVVFRRHPQLKAIREKLYRSGARPAMMTGSGGAVFGFFREREQIEQALSLFQNERVFPISLVSRKRYHSLWFRQLAAHIGSRTWPLRSRYAE
jgi:4-diphosphocytidyl-2-C-methyl-D-erythritol kinase